MIVEIYKATKAKHKIGVAIARTLIAIWVGMFFLSLLPEEPYWWVISTQISVLITWCLVAFQAINAALPIHGDD